MVGALAKLMLAVHDSVVPRVCHCGHVALAMLALAALAPLTLMCQQQSVALAMLALAGRIVEPCQYVGARPARHVRVVKTSNV